MAKLDSPEHAACKNCSGKIIKVHDTVPFFHTGSGAIRCDNRYDQVAKSHAEPK